MPLTDRQCAFKRAFVFKICMDSNDKGVTFSRNAKRTQSKAFATAIKRVLCDLVLDEDEAGMMEAKDVFAGKLAFLAKSRSLDLQSVRNYRVNRIRFEEVPGADKPKVVITETFTDKTVRQMVGIVNELIEEIIGTVYNDENFDFKPMNVHVKYKEKLLDFTLGGEAFAQCDTLGHNPSIQEKVMLINKQRLVEHVIADVNKIIDGIVGVHPDAEKLKGTIDIGYIEEKLRTKIHSITQRISCKSGGMKKLQGIQTHMFVHTSDYAAQHAVGSTTKGTWTPFLIGPGFSVQFFHFIGAASKIVFLNLVQYSDRRVNLLLYGMHGTGKTSMVAVFKEYFGGEQVQGTNINTAFSGSHIGKACILLVDEFPKISTLTQPQINNLKQELDIQSTKSFNVKHKDIAPCFKYIPWVLSSNYDINDAEKSDENYKAIQDRIRRVYCGSKADLDLFRTGGPYKDIPGFDRPGMISNDFFQRWYHTYMIAVAPFFIPKDYKVFYSQSVALLSVRSLYRILKHPVNFHVFYVWIEEDKCASLFGEPYENQHQYDDRHMKDVQEIDEAVNGCFMRMHEALTEKCETENQKKFVGFVDDIKKLVPDSMAKAKAKMFALLHENLQGFNPSDDDIFELMGRLYEKKVAHAEVSQLIMQARERYQGMIGIEEEEVE